ncbi:MAG: endonuclease/exonuclease/phosphatase family protein [Deltaproteobacteria bacterium]|nr:endonuclease/exonuclease/phosphatase family protein [Deltaproteobacteria bacterium]
MGPSLHAARGYDGWTPNPPRSQAELLTRLDDEYGSGEKWLQSLAYLAGAIAVGAGGMRVGGGLFNRFGGRNRLLSLNNFRLVSDEFASAFLFTGYFRSQGSGEGYGEASVKDFSEGVIARTVLNQAVSRVSGGVIHPHLTRFLLMPAFMAIGGWIAESAIEKNKRFSDIASEGFGWELGYRSIGAFMMMNVQSNLLRSPRLFGFNGSFHADDWVDRPTPAVPIQVFEPTSAPVKTSTTPSPFSDFDVPPPFQTGRAAPVYVGGLVGPTTPDRRTGLSASHRRRRRPFERVANSRSGRVAAPPASQIRTVADIHAGHFATPHRGKGVRGLRGVVTAVDRDGFWLQEPSRGGDGSFAGVYVRTKNPTIRTGDLLSLSGEVSVYRPNQRELSQTRIIDPTYSRIGKGRLPEPVLIGEGGRLPPPDLFKGGGTAVDLENRGTPFRPDQDAIAFYRGLKDTRVRVKNARVVGVSSKSSLYAVAIDGGKHMRHRTPEGLPILLPGGPNTDVLSIDFQLLPRDQSPQLEAGDRIVGDLVGILDYSFGQYRIRVTEPVRVEKGGLKRTTVTSLVGDEEHFTVADSNFESFFPKDPNPRRITELAQIIMTNMRNPDLIALQEGMDDSGSKDDGVTTASYEQLNAEIERLGGKRYQYVEVAPKNDQDGGKPGGNIRVAYLVRTDRVSLKLHDGGDYNDPAALEMWWDGHVHLRQNPSRVDPDNPAYERSRKPLAIEYSFKGRTVLQVNAHSTSRRGDDPLWGRYQPATSKSDQKRKLQHAPVAAFFESARKLDPDAAFIAGGDLNAYAWEQSVRIFTDAGLVNLAEAKLPPGADYTYYYEGAAHVHSFDHLLASPELAREAEIEILHLNTLNRNQFSDHDIKIARFRVPKGS